MDHTFRREGVECRRKLGDIDPHTGRMRARWPDVEPDGASVRIRPHAHPRRCRTIAATFGILSKPELQRATSLIESRPGITVMFATIRGWPDARLPVDAAREQLERVRGEM